MGFCLCADLFHKRKKESLISAVEDEEKDVARQFVMSLTIMVMHLKESVVNITDSGEDFTGNVGTL